MSGRQPIARATGPGRPSGDACTGWVSAASCGSGDECTSRKLRIWQRRATRSEIRILRNTWCWGRCDRTERWTRQITGAHGLPGVGLRNRELVGCQDGRCARSMCAAGIVSSWSSAHWTPTAGPVPPQSRPPRGLQRRMDERAASAGSRQCARWGVGRSDHPRSREEGGRGSDAIKRYDHSVIARDSHMSLRCPLTTCKALFRIKMQLREPGQPD
jgi:hypothetical protein